MKYTLLVVCLWVFLGAGTSRADGTFNLYFENDLFGSTDQQYTNGVRASWISPNLEKTFFNDPNLPEWVRNYNSALKFFHELNPNNSNSLELERNLVITLGQTMFTPDEELDDVTTLIEDDRPYAGYLFFGMAYHTKSDDQLDTIEIDLGMVGPSSRAHETQDFIHESRGLDTFEGWDNQLKDEPTLHAIYEHKHKVPWHSLFDDHIQQELIWHAGFSLGNFASYLNAGAEYRIGLQLPQDFGTASLRPGGDSGSPFPADVSRVQPGFNNLHLFVSVDARAVANDVTLDGNTWKDSHSVDKKPLVGDIATGISFSYNRWKFSYSQVFRSKSFEGQRDSHSYGAISVSYTGL